MLLDRDLDLLDLRLGQEVAAEREPELLDRRRQVLARERVGRVLHRVGGDDAGVVALVVGRGEVAAQRDRDRQVPDPMAA